MELEGANPVPFSTGERPLSGVTHLYAGADPAGWRRDIPHYASVRYQSVYPGIDLVYRSQAGRLEYEFRVEPQSDPARIRLSFPGGECAVAPEGDLVVQSDGASLRQHRPLAWQQIGGERHAVSVNFEVRACTVGFRLGAYNARYPLWIDPLVTFSSYLGGGGWDAAYAVAADVGGNIYVTGETASADFPRPSGGTGPSPTNRQVFVTKMTGATLVFTTVLSSGGNDSGRGIAVDSAGNVCIAGIAGGPRFPVTTGVVGPVFGGVQDAFVAKLDSTGHLTFATYLGGAGADAAYGVALDASGLIYVAGATSSTSFPTTTGSAQTRFAGSQDAFVVKLSATGSTMLYSTLLGGAGIDLASSIAVDASGNAVIAGSTDSSNLSVRNALQPAYGGSGDGLVASLNPSGSYWNFVTYLGGHGPDQANALALDTAGNCYITGSTYAGIFAPSAFSIGPRGGYDLFVTKLSAVGAPIFNSLLGGSGTDVGTTIAVDPLGRTWVGGYTTSLDFPLRNTGQQPAQGDFDGLVFWLSADGSSLLDSTILGGAGDDRVWGLALGWKGPVAVGYTSSTSFPTTAGAIQVTAPAGYNSFVTRLAPFDPTKVGVFRSGFWQLDTSGTALWSPGTARGGNFGWSGGIPVLGDWTGSGRTNVGIWSGGLWQLDLSGTAQWNPVTTMQGWLGLPGDIPVVGDWDGSGKTKVGVWRNGTWYLDLSGTAQWSSTQTIQLSFGQPGDIPVVGDWDGSGRTKIGVFRKGVWILNLTPVSQFNWIVNLQGSLGLPGDTPVVGDWDGTGKTKVGVWRNGVWYLDISGAIQWNPATTLQISLGQAGDTPVVGDWSASGKTRIGIWRSGLWLLNSSEVSHFDPGSTLPGWFGLPGDVPITGRW